MVPPVSLWLLVILLTLFGLATLVALRWSAPMTGELQLYRKEEHDGHDADVCVIKIPLYGSFRMVSLDDVHRIPNTAAKIFVMAHRNLLTGVVRLRVGIRFTALRRWAIRDMPEGDRLLILGLDARHVRPQQHPPLTAVLTQPN